MKIKTAMISIFFCDFKEGLLLFSAVLLKRVSFWLFYAFSTLDQFFFRLRLDIGLPWTINHHFVVEIGRFSAWLLDILVNP